MIHVALPVEVREYLPRLPSNLMVSWYNGPDEASDAASTAEVFFADFLPAKVIETVISSGASLRWFASNQVGVEKWPLDLIARRGILATNGAGTNSTAIAEMTVLAILAATKDFAKYVRAQDRHAWLPPDQTARELEGASALIIGFGSIGRAIAGRLQGFGVRTIGVRRRSNSEPGVIGVDSWRGRLGEFDWVILSVPLTASTRHLVGAAELAAMRSSAWLANVARGALIDRQALIEALQSGKIGGVYLDAAPGEPLDPEDPMWALPNVIITPHTSAQSERRLARSVEMFLANLERFRRGEKLEHMIDPTDGY